MRLLSICFSCASVIPSLLRAASNAASLSILLSFLIDSSTCANCASLTVSESSFARCMSSSSSITRDDSLRCDLREELGKLGIGQSTRVRRILQLAKRVELNAVELASG